MEKFIFTPLQQTLKKENGVRLSPWFPVGKVRSGGYTLLVGVLQMRCQPDIQPTHRFLTKLDSRNGLLMGIDPFRLTHFWWLLHRPLSGGDVPQFVWPQVHPPHEAFHLWQSFDCPPVQDPAQLSNSGGQAASRQVVRPHSNGADSRGGRSSVERDAADFRQPIHLPASSHTVARLDNGQNDRPSRGLGCADKQLSWRTR